MSDTAARALFDRERGWFTRVGPEFDAVLSSRVRLARNIEGFPFPAAMSDDQQAELESVLTPVLESAFPGDNYRFYDLDTLSEREQRRLRERNLLADTEAHARPWSLIERADEGVGLCINMRDHLRIAGLRAGLALEAAFHDAREVESRLDHLLRFAVNMEFGYLTRDIDNCGTGMRASVLVHLPALEAFEATGHVLGSLFADRMRVKTFRSGSANSLGAVYQLSNRETLGKSEESLLGDLEGAVDELLQLERAARSELLDRHGEDVRSGVESAYRTLRDAESLAGEEAVTALLEVRFGVTCGLIDTISLSTATTLLFVVQKCHILSGVENEGDDVGARRAGLVRQVLGGMLSQR